MQKKNKHILVADGFLNVDPFALDLYYILEIRINSP